MVNPWKALGLTEDGRAAQHDLKLTSLNQRLSGDCLWTDVHEILIQLLSYLHPDGFRKHTRTYPNLSRRLWHAAIALDQITYIMEGPSNFTKNHTNSTRSVTQPNLDQSWCKIYDSVHDRWHDIWLWSQYLVSRGLLARDSPLDIPQKQLLFTVVLDFFRICLSPQTAGHFVQRDAFTNTLPMVCKLWYLQATDSNFSFLELSSITILYKGMGCQYEAKCGEIGTGSMHLVDQMAQWSGKSVRKVIAAVLAELRHYRDEPLDDACHINHAIFIIDRFQQTSLTRYTRDLLLAQDSLHLVTRAIVHCVSQPFLPKPHRVTGHVLYLCFRYIVLNLDGTGGVLGVNRVLRAGILPALIKASLWLPEITSLGFKLPFYLMFYIIGKYSIYISVLRLIARQMKKIKRQGLEKLIVKDDTLHQEWTKFAILVLHRLDLAGPSMLRICDNKLCNRVDFRYKFPSCAMCGEGCFCSRECQAHVWKFGNHKERCKEIQSRRTVFTADGTSIELAEEDRQFALRIAQHDMHKNKDNLLKILLSKGPCREYNVAMDYGTSPPDFSFPSPDDNIAWTIPYKVSFVIELPNGRGFETARTELDISTTPEYISLVDTLKGMASKDAEGRDDDLNIPKVVSGAS